MNLSIISVKRPIAVIMVVLIFLVIGLYSLSMFSIELMPKMELSMALVYTSYPNVGSQEVENLVTKTIEGAVSSVSGAKSITSQSSEGSSMVMIEFSSKTDMDKATQDISDSIDMIESYLPEDANEPMVLKLDTSMMPAAMLSVSYEGMDPIQTKKYVEDNVQNKLEAVDGVASVTVSGAQDRVIEVEVDPEKLFGNGVDMTDIATAIAAQNVNLPSGTTENKGKKLSVRSVGKFNSVDEINTIPLVTDAGQIVYLRDVATVSDTYSDQTTIARLNGTNSLAMTISAESDANTVDVVDNITAALEKIKAENPKFSYNMTMEQASYIKESISSVAESAVTGAILAVLILLLFLANFKTSMVIGISMPISVITTFIGMYFSGMSLNVVSLGGLALGVGMLVDNSVVVLENIFRRRNELGENAEDSAIKGSSEVIGAVIASVLTTCIVYVPILFIDNMMAVMFKQLAFTIIFSQCASLLATFLLVPMLASKIKKDEPNKKL
ncbi:MAG: efflux RND transporter permease subunit, partial [Clostridia bacterium]|nr:efflux RND transporter permease subunit [Clostridia bacterium]